MATAGGKVILCGEHAVIYGGDALAIGLPCGIEATAQLHEHITLRVNGTQLEDSEPSVEALRLIVNTLESPAVALDVTLSMPIGVGLGASAAMAVAITRAIGDLHGQTCTQQQLLAAANTWEGVFHGTPSGVDAACAALGGCLRYNRTDGPRRNPVGRPLHLAIAVASPPSLTKVMVERVRKFRAQNRRAFEQQLSAIQNLVSQACRVVAEGDAAELGALLNQNHALLSAWDLSTDGIETARVSALSAGAYGAKVTGAGGGGCVLAVCSEATQGAVVDAWRRLSVQTLAVRIESDPVQA